MTARALDGGSMARSVRTMAHSPKSATDTIIGDPGTTCADEGWGGVEVEADSGLGAEGFGGLR